jgi:hypothetical protein
VQALEQRPPLVALDVEHHRGRPGG